MYQYFNFIRRIFERFKSNTKHKHDFRLFKPLNVVELNKEMPVFEHLLYKVLKISQHKELVNYKTNDNHEDFEKEYLIKEDIKSLSYIGGCHLRMCGDTCVIMLKFCFFYDEPIQYIIWTGFVPDVSKGLYGLRMHQIDSQEEITNMSIVTGRSVRLTLIEKHTQRKSLLS